MRKDKFIELLNQLPDDIDITIQTCRYDGTSEVYDDEEPRFITNERYAILTGEHNIFAQSDACRQISYLHRTEIVRLLSRRSSIVKVD